MFKPKGLKTIAQDILNDIKKELRLQGHYDTGELEQSMRVYEADANNENILQGYAAGYIDELENGVAPNRIKISPQEFEDLRGWVMRKIGALSPAESTQIAAAIVRKWKKEGKPLPNSKQFSATGKVTEAIKDAFTRNENNYIGRVDNSVFHELDREFDLPDKGTF